MRNRLPWKLIGKYASKEEANAKDQHSKMWKMKDCRVLMGRTVEKYHCKNKESEGCPAQRCVTMLFRDDSYYVELAFEHNSTCSQKTERIGDLKDEIISVYNSGCLLPWQIRYRMAEDGKDTDIGKIYQTIYRHKKRLLNRGDITTTKVLELCEEFNRIRTEKECSDKKGYIPDLVLKRRENKVLMTTKNSLVLLSEAQNISIDSTYKVIDIGYPVVVVGMTDANQSFVLLAVGIVSDETMETYLWILNVLRRECEKCGLIFKPRNLIADLAPQITQALHQFEPGCFRRHCWFHVLKAMRTVTAGLHALFKDEIMSDIFFLQLISCKTLFEKGWALFLEKWRQQRQTQECIAQLNQQYYLTNGNWYEGCAVHSPSTNNALEKFNQTIKSRYTNRKRLTILEFIRLGVAVAEDYAFEKERVPSKVRYNEAALCRDDYGNDMIFQPVGNMEGHINYLFIGTSETEREMAELLGRKLENLDFATLNDFRDLLSKTVIVSARSSIESLTDVFCSCWGFVKKKKCRHVYLFLTRLGKKELLNSELIFVKNKRGRPKSVKRNTSLLRE